MFDKWSGENIGTHLAGLSEVRSDPYQIDGVDEYVPSPSSVISLPLRASLYYNTMRSGWASFRYLSTLDNKFTRNSLKHQYRMTTVTGLTRDIIESGKLSVERFFRGEAFSKAPIHTDSKAWKIFASSTAENDFMNLGSNWEAGILDRFMTGKSQIYGAVNNLKAAGVITGSKANELLKKNKLVNDIVKYRYTLDSTTSQLPYVKQRDILRSEMMHTLKSEKLIRNIPKTKIEQMDILRKFRQVADKRPYLGENLHKAIDSNTFIKRMSPFKAGRDLRALEKESYSAYHDIPETVSLKDLLLGKADRDKVGFWPNELNYTRVMPIKASMPWNKRKYARTYNTTYEATMRALADNGVSITAGKTAEATIKYAAHQSAVSAVWREKMIKMAKPMFIVSQVAPILAEAAYRTTKAVNETMERTASTMRSLTKMEFGSDDILQSSRMASERQRAVTAIQSSMANARYLFGSEATMYH